MSGVHDLPEFIRRAAGIIWRRVREEWPNRDDVLGSSADSFLLDSAEDLARWSGLVASGALTAEDYRWLVRGRTDLIRLTAMGGAGMTRNQIDRFRGIVVDALVAALLGSVLRRRGD